MYLFFGLLVGGIFGFLLGRLPATNYNTKWYDWVLMFIGAILLLFTFQNFFGGFAEGVSQFSWLMLAIFGTIGAILVILPLVLIFAVRQKSNA